MNSVQWWKYCCRWRHHLVANKDTWKTPTLTPTTCINSPCPGHGIEETWSENKHSPHQLSYHSRAQRSYLPRSQAGAASVAPSTQRMLPGISSDLCGLLCGTALDSIPGTRNNHVLRSLYPTRVAVLIFGFRIIGYCLVLAANWSLLTVLLKDKSFNTIDLTYLCFKDQLSVNPLSLLAHTECHWAYEKTKCIHICSFMYTLQTHSLQSHINKHRLTYR